MSLHLKPLAQLQSKFDNGRLHNSLIFSGMKGLGKEESAFNFAAFILKNGPISEEQLLSKIHAGSHPDFKLVIPEDDAEIISIDQIRELKEFTRLTAIESPNKVVIINSLDALNNNAANALLKILEEPPANTYFICIAHSIGQILPTIRSRCQIVKFNRTTPGEFSSYFSNHVDLDLDELYLYSSGSIGIAKNMLDNNFSTIKSTIQNIVRNGNRSSDNINQIASYIDASNTNWEIGMRIFTIELYQKIKNETLLQSYNPAAMDKINKLLDFFNSAKKAHLDIKQTILSTLS